MIKVAGCIPKQEWSYKDKLEWLSNALSETLCDLFVTPQEYFGGHVAGRDGLHIDRGKFRKEMADLAAVHKKALAVGATTTGNAGGAMQEYAYFAPDGRFCGAHFKFAHPSYDDVRAKGAGKLWPETSWTNRAKPVEIPELGLKIGTVFCWEVFNLSFWAAYSYAGCNMITHPIKFPPRSWCKVHSQKGQRVIYDYDKNNKSDLWVDRLRAASRHEVLCPIIVSCNTWDIGEKHLAICGHVDELLDTTDLIDLSAVAATECILTYEFNPALYTGIDHLFSAGAFKAHVGVIDQYHDLDPWKMHAKVRRLEAHLIGGTTRLDCMLMAATAGRQKPSTIKRARKNKLR